MTDGGEREAERRDVVSHVGDRADDDAEAAGADQRLGKIDAVGGGAQGVAESVAHPRDPPTAFLAVA